VSALDAARKVALALRSDGAIAYFAGGCVRDRLFGQEPKDYDVATDARPETVRRIFPGAHLVGAAFGVSLVHVDGYAIEVATFRRDGPYSDRRRPDHVEYSTAREDALRRDFTINGLFLDPVSWEVIDFVGGRADIDARVLRAIGRAEDRIEEDDLRMLRGVRFAARYGLSVEEATAKAIRERAGRISGVSRERIGQEIRRMMSHESRAQAMRWLLRLGLDGPVLGEAPMPGQPTAVLESLRSQAPLAASLGAWMVDRHGAAGQASITRGASALTAALVLSGTEAKDVRGAVETAQMMLNQWDTMSVASRKRLLAATGSEAGFILLSAWERRRADQIEPTVRCYRASGVAPAPLLTGDDLVALGLSPGPLFKRLLDETYDAQLEGRIESTRDAIEMARSLATGNFTPDQRSNRLNAQPCKEDPQS